MSALAIPHDLISDARTLRSKSAGLRKAIKAIHVSAASYTGKARLATVEKRISLKQAAMGEEHTVEMARLVDEKRELERSAARLSDVQSQIDYAKADAEDCLDIAGKLTGAQKRHVSAEEAALALEESIDRLQLQVLDISSVLSKLAARRVTSSDVAEAASAKAPRVSASSRTSASSGHSGASVERLTLQAEHKRLSGELTAVQAQTAATTASNEAAGAKAEAERNCQRTLSKAQRQLERSSR